MSLMKKTGILALAVILCVALFGGCAGEPETKETVTTTTNDTTTVMTTTTVTPYPFTAFVNATTLNVRPTPDTSGYAIGGLKFADVVTVTGREGDWYAIQFKGEVGYINAQYVQEDDPRLTTTVATTTAATVAGTTTVADTATTTAEAVAP